MATPQLPHLRGVAQATAGDLSSGRRLRLFVPSLHGHMRHLPLLSPSSHTSAPCGRLEIGWASRFSVF